ncbi:TonB-dependent receptor domain-containing protein [Mucilaginibacter lacusdianchii]|uniref:TonB-dependent receptor domain-containing protein n=1 Tax=Mucilaginibacter lacusdianchii TaxID=2684211 RepID=UPI00131DF9FC|nr:TonB-dependent receptor [Mucilaginibacter sp. JXJ CY 39]
MKKVLLTVLLSLCIYNLAVAQLQKSAAIKGVVIDSTINQPLAYVTVGLVDLVSHHQVKSTFTKDNGSFEFTGLAEKPYQVVLVHVGYANKILTVDHLNDGADLGKILLHVTAHQLKDVSVTSVKPLARQDVDRMSYDVQADPESKVLSVLDILRKVPLLSVDAADNIKLQGNTNYRILINGKPSALIARNPADVFRTMPATNIQKIEVITTPPAKYDAEGLAGIINIITKSTIEQGYNGSVNARYSNLFGPGINLNLNAKLGKLGVGGYFGYTRQNTLTNSFLNTTDNYNISYLKQDGSRTSQTNNLYTSTELSYEADTLNLLTASFEYFTGVANFDDAQTLNQQSPIPNYIRNYQTFNDGNNHNGGIGLGANYQLGFKRSKEQLLTVSYKYTSGYNKQFNDVSYLSKTNFADPNYQQYNNSGSKEHTVQLDYVHPLKKWNIEAGAKAIFRKNYSNYSTDTVDFENRYVTDQNLTNDFDYQQNVYSLYNTYQLKLKSWVFKSGLRLEHTTVNAYGNAQVNPYSNLIPSISIQHSFRNSSLNLGYTDRIQRPGIIQLNPFYDRSNPNFRSIGNPDLRPVVSHGMELIYSHNQKGSYSINLNYRFANNTIESVVRSNGLQGISTTTYQNVGKSKRLGVDVDVSYPITSKCTFNLNAELIHAWLRGVYNNDFYNAHGFQGHAFGNVSYRFNNNYRIGASLDFDSRYVLLQGRDNYYLGYSTSASKDFWNKKATFSLNVSNPFNKFRNIDGYIRTPDFYYFNSNQSFARRINLSLNYKFGKLNNGVKKNRRGIHNDDLSSGRGS